MLKKTPTGSLKMLHNLPGHPAVKLYLFSRHSSQCSPVIRVSSLHTHCPLKYNISFTAHRLYITTLCFNVKLTVTLNCCNLETELL